MCEPTTIALGIMAVAGAASAVSQHQAQNAAAESNLDSSIRALADETAALASQGDQISRQGSEDAFTSALDAARAKSAATNQGVNQGLSAASVGDILQGISAQAGRNASIMEANTRAQLAQTERGIGAALSRSQSRINAVPRASNAALAVNLLGVAANTVSTGLTSGALKIPNGGGNIQSLPQTAKVSAAPINFRP